MVYKIRNKAFFWTRGGYKNNWFPKHFNMPKAQDPDVTFALKSRTDHMSYLRLFQNYRNYSRLCKKYFYGDRALEEKFIIALRDIFRVPLTCETPTHLIKHGGERRMADQADRDFELISNNTHPYQMALYEKNNQIVLEEVENEQLRAQGLKPIEDQIYEYVENKLKEATQGGQKPSFEQTMEITYAAKRKARDELGLTGNLKDQDGKYFDFQEVRRPFVAPNNAAYPH